MTIRVRAAGAGAGVGVGVAAATLVVAVSVGAEHGLLLGLDFPAGELGGPEGGWLRMRRNGPALHWRIARTQARWIWAIVRREVEDDGAEPAQSAAAAHGRFAVYV